MRQRGTTQRLVALVVTICVLAAGCAQTMQSPTQSALLCGAGGAAVGAAVGGAVSRDLRGALIGAAAGALMAGLSCFAVAEYNSRQVRDHRQTREATGYQPAEGDVVRITQYELKPGAAPPGSEIAFNATYLVMTPDPDQDVTVTEVRSLHAFDAATGGWRELGRVPSQVTMRPGTRAADGKFQVRSGVAEGPYRVVFQVARNGTSDTQELTFTVTRDKAMLASAPTRVAQPSVPGGKLIEPAPPAPAPSAAPDRPLSALGEAQPQAPAVASAPAPAPGARRDPVRYFVASKVEGAGTLRAGPGPSHPVVGSIGRGERYPIVDAQVVAGAPTWYRIRLDTGAEAWVAAALGNEVAD